MNITKESENYHRPISSSKEYSHNKKENSMSTHTNQRNPKPYYKKPYHSNNRTGTNRNSTHKKPSFYFNTVCTVCKTQTRVPFKPDGIRPVYCKTCLRKFKQKQSSKRT